MDTKELVEVLKQQVEVNGKLDEHRQFAALQQIRRKVTNLYRHFLCTLEDLQSDGCKIPETKFKQIRKRVLDQGNDTIREIEEYLSNYHLKERVFVTEEGRRNEKYLAKHNRAKAQASVNKEKFEHRVRDIPLVKPTNSKFNG